MKNILICTHSDLAIGLKNAACMIVPTIDSIETVCFENGYSIDWLIHEIDKKVQKYRDAKESYLILTDMIGASPFNASIQVANKDKIPVLCGVNLPILLELLTTEFDNEDKIEEMIKLNCDTIKLFRTSKLFADENG